MAHSIGEGGTNRKNARWLRALARAAKEELFHELASLPDDLGENPFPASLEATLKPDHQGPEEVRRLARRWAMSLEKRLEQLYFEAKPR